MKIFLYLISSLKLVWAVNFGLHSKRRKKFQLLESNELWNIEEEKLEVRSNYLNEEFLKSTKRNKISLGI